MMARRQPPPSRVTPYMLAHEIAERLMAGRRGTEDATWMAVVTLADGDADRPAVVIRSEAFLADPALVPAPDLPMIARAQRAERVETLRSYWPEPLWSPVVVATLDGALAAAEHVGIWRDGAPVEPEPERIRLAAESLASGETREMAARRVGVTDRTIYRWQGRYPALQRFRQRSTRHRRDESSPCSKTQ